MSAMSASTVRSFTPVGLRTALTVVALLVTMGTAQADIGLTLPVGRPLPVSVVPATAPVADIVFSGDGTVDYDGNPHVVTATATPSATVQVTYEGSLTAPSAAGTYAVLATVMDGPDAGAIATTSLVIVNATMHLRQGPFGWGQSMYQTTPPSGVDLVAVAANTRLWLGLTRSGHVVAWQNPFNDYGEQDVPAGLDNVVAITSGGTRAMAVRADGTLVGWGRNDYGQLDDHGVTDAVQAAMTSYATVVLHSDGSLSAWGYSADTVLTHLPTDSDFIAISGYSSFMLGLHADGTVTAWGSDPYSSGVLTVPSGLTDVTAISAGYFACLALKSDGTVVKWGADLGNTPMPDLSDPATAHVAAISIGEIHGVMLKDDGTLVEFGNFWTRPTGLNGQRITAVAAGFSVTVAAAGPTLPTYDRTGHDLSAEIITEPAGLDVAVTYDGFTSPDLPLHAGAYGYSAAITTPGSTAVALTGSMTIKQRPIRIDGDYIYLHIDDPLPSPLPFTADYSPLPLVAGDTYASAFTGAMEIGPDNNTLGWHEITRGTLASSDYDITDFSSGYLNRMPENTPPNAGEYGPQQLVRGEDDGTALYAYYSDDDEDYFGQVITVAWSVQSAPIGGVVTFADAASVNTSITTTYDGVYVLRLTVDDGFTSDYADLTVTVVTPVELLFTDDTVTYDGSPHTLAVTTNPSGYTVLPTFNGTPAVGAINAGTYAVSGSLSTPFTVARGTPGTLTIGKATTTLSFAADPVSLPYSGQPQVVTASADAVPPITGTVSVTYDGDNNAPSAVGTYALEATLSDVNYDAAPVSGNLEITATTAATVRLVPRMVNQSGSTQPTAPPEAADLVQVIPTTGNFLALTHDGHVVTWGVNAPATLPAALAGGGVLAIANGLDYDLAVNSDGSLVAWGADSSGVVADVPTSGTYLQVAALRGYYTQALALGTDGNVVSWGGSDISLPAEVTSGGHVVAITAGSFHFLALLDDGSVVGIGYAPVVTPPADLSGVTAISAGYQFSVALKDDGTVVTWGSPTYDVSVPTDLTGVTAIAAGTNHVAALKADGTVSGWGTGWYSALPQNTLTGLPGVVAISAAEDITVALTTAPEPVIYDGTTHAFTTAIVTDPVGLDVVVTYDGSPTPPTHAGTHVVTVMADPYAGYHSALSVSGLRISPRSLDSLTVNSSHIHVGDALPAITGSAVGLVGSDTFATLVAPFAIHGAADSSTVGSYPIDITAAHLADYDVLVINNGTLHVHAANTAPILSGTTDLLTATMGSPVALGQSYYDEDEDIFSQVVTATWTQVSGPGTASFVSAGADTTASFDRDGVYALRYTVDDGYVPVVSDQRVLVSLPGTVVADDSSYDARVTCSLGGTWVSGVLTGVAGSATQKALAGAAADWTVVPPETGWYELSYYHVNDQQPATPYSATVYHADGTSAVPYGGSKLATGWVSLGAFRCAGSGLELYVTTGGVSGCALRADAVRLIRLPGTLVDNGRTGYQENGSGWTGSTLGNKGVTGNPTRYSRSLAATATWSDPGLTGEARVLFYRLPLSNNDPEWLATLTGGDGDHHFAVDARSGATGWADLGRHRFTGSAAVTLGHDGTQVLRTDAVRFALDTVVGPGDLGYREAGGQWFDSSQTGHAGTVRYSRYSMATVIYRASLAPGAYRVSWYRMPYLHDSPVVKLQVSGGNPGFTGTSDLGSGPAGWAPLGDFIFKTGVGQVQIKRSVFSVTPLRIDAVRFEPLGDDAPVGVVPDGGAG